MSFLLISDRVVVPCQPWKKEQIKRVGKERERERGKSDQNNIKNFLQLRRRCTTTLNPYSTEMTNFPQYLMCSFYVHTFVFHSWSYHSLNWESEHNACLKSRSCRDQRKCSHIVENKLPKRYHGVLQCILDALVTKSCKKWNQLGSTPFSSACVISSTETKKILDAFNNLTIRSFHFLNVDFNKIFCFRVY